MVFNVSFEELDRFAASQSMDTEMIIRMLAEVVDDLRIDGSSYKRSLEILGGARTRSGRNTSRPRERSNVRTTNRSVSQESALQSTVNEISRVIAPKISATVQSVKTFADVVQYLASSAPSISVSVQNVAASVDVIKNSDTFTQITAFAGGVCLVLFAIYYESLGIRDIPFLQQLYYLWIEQVELPYGSIVQSVRAQRDPRGLNALQTGIINVVGYMIKDWATVIAREEVQAQTSVRLGIPRQFSSTVTLPLFLFRVLSAYFGAFSSTHTIQNKGARLIAIILSIVTSFSLMSLYYEAKFDTIDYLKLEGSTLFARNLGNIAGLFLKGGQDLTTIKTCMLANSMVFAALTEFSLGTYMSSIGSPIAQPGSLFDLIENGTLEGGITPKKVKSALADIFIVCAVILALDISASAQRQGTFNPITIFSNYATDTDTILYLIYSVVKYLIPVSQTVFVSGGRAAAEATVELTGSRECLNYEKMYQQEKAGRSDPVRLQLLDNKRSELCGQSLRTTAYNVGLSGAFGPITSSILLAATAGSIYYVIPILFHFVRVYFKTGKIPTIEFGPYGLPRLVAPSGSNASVKRSVEAANDAVEASNTAAKPSTPAPKSVRFETPAVRSKSPPRPPIAGPTPSFFNTKRSLLKKVSPSSTSNEIPYERRFGITPKSKNKRSLAEELAEI